MAEMLLINPRRRRKAKKAAPARKRRTSHKRRRNPIANLAAHSPVRRRSRRAAPARARRRRNPISLGGKGPNSIMVLLKEAAIGGAGAVAMDVAMGYANQYLPASLQTVPTAVGIGDVVKAALTIAAGKFLDKPTKGLAMKAAKGALACQVRDILAVQLPTTMTLGYASPAKVVPGTPRLTAQGSRAISRVPGNVTPLAAYQRQALAAYTPANGRSPMLSNSSRVMQREGVMYR